MTDKEIMAHIRANSGLKTKKEIAAALYGAIAFCAFNGEVERAKKLAQEYGCKL